MGKDFLSNIDSIKMLGEYPISKYRKVIKKADPAQESEIRVRVNSPPFAYAAYAGKLLLQKDFDYVYLNATGAAVSNSIKVIEYLKTHIKGLHISYNILSKEFVDEYEPKVEGLDKVTTTRTVSTLEAKLTIKKGEELAKEVGYMAPSANEDDIDQKGFEDSMAKYNERKATKQDGGDRRGGNRDGYKRGGDRRPRTQSGKYNDNEERKEGGNGGERRTNNYDNREGGDRRRYNNDNRDGGDRRRNDNRDGGDRRNDNRDVKRYDNRDNRDNRNRDNYNKDNNRDEKRYDNRDNRDNRNRDNYTKTDNYQKDDRRTDDRRDGGDRNYDNRRREDGDNRGGRGRGGDRGGRDRRENDNRNENYQKDYKNDRD